MCEKLWTLPFAMSFAPHERFAGHFEFDFVRDVKLQHLQRTIALCFLMLFVEVVGWIAR